METLRVLVVDDELGMRLGVQRALRKQVVRVEEADDECTFVVDSAETGEEGLEKINDNPPDILFLDHKLPGMNGLEVLTAITEEQKENMLIIMITAYATIEAAVTATKKGTYDFLAKPFSPAELRATITKAATRLVLIRHARRLEEEKRHVRFEFIRVLGHELKAPIGAVEGYLNILNDKTLGNDITAYEGMIDRSRARLQQMRRLITDLLDMTRLDYGEKQRNLEELDVRPIAEHALEAQAIVAERRGIELVFHAPDKVPMMADHTELEIIFNNLISNAVKYNRDEGKVTVDLIPTDEDLTIRVADTGIGMEQGEVEKLFEEFVRIKNRKTKNIMGTGLGLSIMKRIVQLYNGETKVTSEADVGTTFSVVLRKA